MTRKQIDSSERGFSQPNQKITDFESDKNEKVLEKLLE